MSRPLQLKLTGRPKGRKDSKPRKNKTDRHDELSTSPGSAVQVPWHWHDMHGVAGNFFEQDSLQMQPSQQANQSVWITQCTDPAAYFEDSSAEYRSAASSSALYSTSVDEQLHEWDSFWRASTSADPFSGEWNPSRC
uniref:Uncharacterized protein n=1 Tax=Cryptomonas curvata TaxID=233186 RepID=A0A7S0QGD8_9CRYP|mmetsp:Transcript_20716/g.43544  ORF Transcript_20716/g.43544 Transcript_20716/m.43544 type:complete len:137 (+) Transcript_20716:205-615(+)